MYCPRTTSVGWSGSMLRKTLFFSSLMDWARAMSALHGHEGEDLEEVGHHHVAKCPTFS